jgi:hypothetical protein
VPGTPPALAPPETGSGLASATPVQHQETANNMLKSVTNKFFFM